MATITVRHNFEMAHRLFQSPGKCEAIHGHSWWVELSIMGPVDATGKVLEFGAVKKAFRQYLDDNFDHRLLLNEEDPWAKLVMVCAEQIPNDTPDFTLLPGLQRFAMDPTTENVAQILYYWGKAYLQGLGGDFRSYSVRIDLWETSVNKATVGDF